MCSKDKVILACVPFVLACSISFVAISNFYFLSHLLLNQCLDNSVYTLLVFLLLSFEISLDYVESVDMVGGFNKKI
jgi:hypothetical protein